MFLTRNGLKKMMTQAYKGIGLKVRNDGVGLSITGARWSVYFLRTDIPKETLGDLISLVGQLPACMECYVASKEGNQMELYDPDLVNAMPAGQNAQYELERLPLVLMSGGPIGILQNPSFEKWDVTLIDYGAFGKINPALIDRNSGETAPDGPVSGGGIMVEGQFMAAATWYNNRMGFSVGFAAPIDEYGSDVANIIDKHRLWRMDSGRAAEVEAHD